MITLARTLRHALLGLAITLAPAPLLAATIDVGTKIGAYTGDTRGFHFTAPTDFVIVGLDLPTDASTENFDVAVLRFSTLNAWNGDPSVYDVLFESRDQGAALTGLSIAISAGDIIGILGSRAANAVNSYGSANYSSSILGSAVTLTRLSLQSDLRTEALPTSAQLGSSTGGSGSIGRVLVDVAPASISAVPLPGALPLMALSLGALVLVRRRA
jgi:hypothetical protein